MKTRMREIMDLNIPRDRERSFKTSVFESYSRSMGIDELIMTLYYNDISKLDEGIGKIFPGSDFKLCSIHASRNLESDLRESDKNEIDHDLKDRFISYTKDSAMKNSITSRVNGHQSIQGLYTV